MATQKSFHFKQFSISIGNCGMPVSTDGVLLGAWIQSDKPNQLLDIGTGTGLLALMCAQRFSTAQITALDIDPHAVEIAMFNCQNSPWQARIRVKNQNFFTYHPEQTANVIICNPPYFESGEVSAIESRAKARHTLAFTHEQWILQCKHVLHPTGRANFILPYTEGQQFIQIALQAGWFLSRCCIIQPTETKPPHRLLIELSLTPIAISEKTTLVIQDKNQYSDAFIALTKDFYLKM